ncbi:hypothetical protein BB559_006933 [Furculomyces boomerangus]|uniref:Ketosynthase family 3 (KS3) domain-containing protein n=1 Tax=Furculomyces boomerangus TaxID=61424 RepID=A0A2T9XZT9_9FUNG|nr:hypothetical protein BB559_006933 [Furculomyces boomerangus]
METKGKTLILAEGSVLTHLYENCCQVNIKKDYHSILVELISHFENSDYADDINLEDNGSELVVFFKFMEFILEQHKIQKIGEFKSIFSSLFEQLLSNYMSNEDIHIAIQQVDDSDIKSKIINIYYQCALTVNPHAFTIPTHPVLKKHETVSSTLFDSVNNGKSSILGIFGGQGISKNYFDELKQVYITYKPILRDFMTEMNNTFSSIHKEFSQKVYFPFGFNVVEWIENDDACPDISYLIQSSISFPLIGLTQLLNIYVLSKSLKSTPGEIVSKFKALTGHSQGIVTAVALSCSTSEASFMKNSKIAITTLLYIGLKTQIAYPSESINPEIIKDAIQNFEESPSPMLLVAGLTKEHLLKYIQKTNMHLSPNQKIVISIKNSFTSFVVSGPTNSLYSLAKILRSLRITEEDSQNRIPHSERKKAVNVEFLQVSVPFHSLYLEAVSHDIVEHLEKNNIVFATKDLSVPINSFFDGSNLQNSSNITRDIVFSICHQELNWITATNVPGITHIVDFGPGGITGIGGITERNKEGTGVSTIFAGIYEANLPQISTKAVFFAKDSSYIKYSDNWEQKYSPKLVCSKYDPNVIYIDTKMSRLLGKPPIMIAGMTPSTVNTDFVSAVTNSGYHIELAGGGYYNKESLTEAVEKVSKSIEHGYGISINIIFMNVAMSSVQIPLVQMLRAQGSPLEGLCISAGVPSLETCTELIEGLQALGFKHISFKPGSSSAIRQVVRIAKKNKDMAIMLQWTGGRGGGHHSFEDFHQPIIENYGEIRSAPNIVLVAGSGFGGSDDTLPYLTGDWSLTYDKAKMPFDGVLFGSRMMVAKECGTSDNVKELIINTPGVKDSDWEKTYKGPAGGVISVISELGEPIHMVANRGVMLWRELDDTIFNLPKPKMLEKIKEKQEYIIERLNNDYQKLWFGKKSDGSIAMLDDMTYAEIVMRMIELMYIKKLNKWQDVSYRNSVGDFLRRIDERFSDSEHESLLQSNEQIDNPFDKTKMILDSHPNSYTQVIVVEDIHYFLDLCTLPGRKPVPFIPVLDENFSTWFKRDSLWQSENIEAVMDEDAGRVCVLQGPVSVRYSTEANIPVKKIMDDINQAHINAILKNTYNNDVSKIPKVEYLDDLNLNLCEHVSELNNNPKCRQRDTKGYTLITKNGRAVYTLDSSSENIPNMEQWAKTLTESRKSWLQALLNARFIVSDGKHSTNNLRSVMKPRVNNKVVVYSDKDNMPTRVEIRSQEEFNDVEIEYNNKERTINFCLNYKCKEKVVPLLLHYSYKPEMPSARIHELTEGRNDRIKQFYSKIWVSNNSVINLEPAKYGCIATQKNIKVSKEDILRFSQIIGNNSSHYIGKPKAKSVVIPMDFVFVIAWEALCSVSTSVIEENMLDMVHYSNKFESLNEGKLLTTEDNINVSARTVSFVNEKSGHKIEVEAIVYKDEEPYFKINTVSLFVGTTISYEKTFKEVEESPMVVKLTEKRDLATILSKEWFIPEMDKENLIDVGSELIFRLTSNYRFASSKIYSSVRTAGSVEIATINRSFIKVATVDYRSGSAYGNPVVEYLKRYGVLHNKPNDFEGKAHTVIPQEDENLAVFTSHKSNIDFSRSSKDYNPIHTNPYFADFSGLPGTIAHGMWTSATTRKIVETFAAGGNPDKVSLYEISFLDMVLPGELLETKLYHVGMIEGKKIIRIETTKCDSGSKVLEGIAHVIPQKTVYVFTGQGSQSQNMGMDLYKSSESARKIWDSADKHMFEKYGFSLLYIIQNNPTSLAVSFRGMKGSHIRKNYMSLEYEGKDKNGNTKMLPMFPEIDPLTKSYTFRSPLGLINSTEFTQQLIMLYEVIAFEDMVEKQLIHRDLMFAGHSLGEFCALSAIGRVLSVEAMVEMIFYRGIAMQNIVQRDQNGNSNYGMIAFNPMRVSPSFVYTLYNQTIESLRKYGQGLIETVNYNTENYQYVIAGELRLLKAFAKITDYLSFNKLELARLEKMINTEKESQLEYESVLKKVILEVLQLVDSEAKMTGSATQKYVLERSNCTIPLPGIDVPFHSSFLNPGVDFIRQLSLNTYKPENIVTDFLEGRYIPNIVGKPFQLSKDYFELVYKHTNSPIIMDAIKNWNESEMKDPIKRQLMAHSFIVEMISYQFASPVQWIKTQDVLFKDFKFERFVEIGPSKILCGMAERTLKLKYLDYDNANLINRQFLCYSSDQNEIYYNNEIVNQTSAKPTPSPENTASIAKPIKEKKSKKQDSFPKTPEKVLTNEPISHTPAVANVSSSPSNLGGGPVMDIEDVSIDTSVVITCIIAQKMKKRFNEISSSKSIKDIVNGKSAMQNEIVGDLVKEFPGMMPEKLEEIPLSELFESIDKQVDKLGSYTAVKVSRLIISKMPVGFTLPSVKSILKTKYGLGPLRSDLLLLVGITMEPDSRIPSNDEAHNWINKVAMEYASIANITYKSSDGGAGQGTVSTGVVVNSEELTKIQKKQDSLLYSQLTTLADYLGVELLRDQDEKSMKTMETSENLQKELDLWSAEHGEAYAEGIKPAFMPNKIRVYDSYWNWAHHNFEEMFLKLFHGEYIGKDAELVNSIEYKYKMLSENKIKLPKDTNHAISYVSKKLEKLLAMCKNGIGQAPLYFGSNEYLGPKTVITKKGDLVYKQVPREGINDHFDFIKSMLHGFPLKNPVTVVEEENDGSGEFDDQEDTKNKNIYESRFKKYAKFIKSNIKENRLPYLNLRERLGFGTSWVYSKGRTIKYYSALLDIAENGLSLEGKKVLITGCGDKSIGFELLKVLLISGAQVVATTSRLSFKYAKTYQKLYREYGSKGSKLILVPFNQGSLTDVNNLIDYIYCPTQQQGLGWDLDIMIPFGAISANNREISEFDSISEYSHRVMLTNLIRMIGRVKYNKSLLRIETNPAQVIVPMSLNHGGFGGDGMYPESKIGLMTLFDRWYSENWRDYINITGTIVGWSRGTSLMSHNDILAEDMEKTGGRTFSPLETAFSISACFHPVISEMNDNYPIYADVSGGFEFVTDFSDQIIKFRKDMDERSEIQKRIVSETSFDFNCVEGDSVERLYKTNETIPRSLLKLDFPELKEYEDLSDKSYMLNMLNLEKTVVVTGFGEVGPQGGAETRWEIEAFGELSIKGCIIMGWVMGLIEYFNGKLKDGNKYQGWVDSATKMPVEDQKIKKIYEKKIIENSGIRIIDPELNRGYDPNAKKYIREVLIDKDMAPIITTLEEAKNFKLRNGDKVKIWSNGDDSWSVQFLKGSSLYVPKATMFDVIVAGQLPKGFNFERYGLTKEFLSHVDRMTAIVMISVCDALMRAGIEDPYEFYKYVHVSEIGSSVGSGVGGSYSTTKIIRDRFLDQDIHSDVLQESFISSMASWVNLMLLSASGPIACPSGACATGAVSIDLATQLIQNGKAKIMFAGGQDDFAEESSYEFYAMKATINSKKDLSDGRDPLEMSRPFSSTRAGFMDALGSGCIILMNAKTALEIGVPIYGILAHTCTASDKVGRSFPAPGKGLLTSAKETICNPDNPLLKFEYRKKQLERRRREIRRWIDDELEDLKMDYSGFDYGHAKDFVNKNLETFRKPNPEILLDTKFDSVIKNKINHILKEAKKMENNALDYWTRDYYFNNPEISPLRGALSTFGLSVDDIDALCCHGTSTLANDLNEAEIITEQLRKLGRSKGNVCPLVSQKSITGHAKGGASSLATNGLIQMLMTGIIPGNLSADNISEEFEDFDLVYNPYRAIKKEFLKAGLLKSLGFGQIGSELLMVNSAYLFASIPKDVYDDYSKRAKMRQIKSERYLYNTLTSTKPHIPVKETPPFSEKDEEKILLNPSSRVVYNKAKNTYAFDRVDQKPDMYAKEQTLELIKTGMEDMTKTQLRKSNISIRNDEDDTQGVGLDVELISSMNIENENFISRNFTKREIEYCMKKPNPQASFAGKWSAKESVVKAIASFGSKTNINETVWKMGAAAPLVDIEIYNVVEQGSTESGAPVVKLHGKALEVSKRVGVKDISVSISHTDDHAASVAIAR